MAAQAWSDTADGSDRIAAALAAALESSGQGAALATRLERLSGGASKENWAFVVEEGDRRQPAVLRCAPAESRFAAAGTISLRAEAELLRLARKAGVPVPKVLFELPEHSEVTGYAMERVEGESIGPRILKDAGLAQTRKQMAHECGALLARIHSIPVERLPQLEQLGPVAGLAELEQRYRSTGQHRPVFELALQWLADRLPGESRETLVHGDFRNGNLIVGPEGIRAVLDWETSHRGAPAEDLGWLCVTSWRFGRPDLPVGGFGTRDQLLAGYRDAGGVEISLEELLFWEAFGSLRWGVMCAEVGARFEEGVKSVEGAMIARRASETEYDLMNLMLGRDGHAG